MAVGRPPSADGRAPEARAAGQDWGSIPVATLHIPKVAREPLVVQLPDWHVPIVELSGQGVPVKYGSAAVITGLPDSFSCWTAQMLPSGYDICHSRQRKPTHPGSQPPWRMGRQRHEPAFT